MAVPLSCASAALSPSMVVDRLRAAFSGFPDFRQPSNRRQYDIEDAALSAFSVFFTQSPSFLDYQIRMQKAQGKNNATALFGVHQIPCDNQIRNLLDPVPAATVFPVIADLGAALYQEGYLDSFRAIGQTFLLALDGTDSFSSGKISCPGCTRQTSKSSGKTCYRHICVTPVLVAPGQEKVVPLPPEFVAPQDGHHKQDCELAAAGRWLARWGSLYAPWHVTLLGDDLYCHQPFCQQAIACGFDFLLTCKPDSHPILYEWLCDLERGGHVHTVIQIRRQGKRLYTDTYRYASTVPLRDTDDALMVNWCELTTTASDGKILYRNAWATTHAINDANVVAMAASGRARWKIENENNNVIKTKGYHFEHNFGHGKQHLANLLTTLILLAFLAHTVLDWVDQTYRDVRQLLPSRRTFFEHLRALLQYLPFDDWSHLMRFMLEALGATSSKPG